MNHFLKYRVITLTACLFFFLTIVNAEKQAVQLTGSEALCEMAAIGVSTSAPGIYIVNQDTGGVKCLIPYGKNPQWSPDHSFLSYWLHGSLYLVNVKMNSSDLASKVFPMMTPPITTQLLWDQTDGSLIYLSTSLKQDLSLHPFRVRQGMHGYGKPLWQREKVEQIGAMDISSDGHYLAYESITFVADTLVVPEEIRVGKVGENSYSVISHQNRTNVILSHPTWQPHGDLLALDAVDTETKMHAVFLWNRSKNILEPVDITGRKIVYFGSTQQYTHSRPSLRFLCWSPRGDALLVFVQPSKETLVPYGPTAIYLVPLDTTKDIIRCDIGTTGYLQRASLSRDGESIMFLSDKSLQSTCYDPNLVIGNFMTAKFSMIRYPDGLQPVNLAW